MISNLFYQTQISADSERKLLPTKFNQPNCGLEDARLAYSFNQCWRLEATSIAVLLSILKLQTFRPQQSLFFGDSRNDHGTNL
jgi:hypothetical protein